MPPWSLWHIVTHDSRPGGLIGDKCEDEVACALEADTDTLIAGRAIVLAVEEAGEHAHDSVERRHFMGLCGMDLDYFSVRMRLGDWLSLFLELLQMEFDCLLDQPQRLFPGFGCGNTPRQIKDISSPARRTFLYNDRIAHKNHPLLEASLLEHIIQGAGRHINAGLSRDRDGSRPWLYV